MDAVLQKALDSGESIYDAIMLYGDGETSGEDCVEYLRAKRTTEASVAFRRGIDAGILGEMTPPTTEREA